MSSGSRMVFEDVSSTILNLIFVQKRFKPNDKLPNESQLAQELGVGRTSIREAVKILASRGILIVQQGRGTFVSDKPDIDPDPFSLETFENKKKLLSDWYEIRLIVEPEGARLASERATEPEIDEILQLEEQTGKIIDEGGDYLPADLKLHTAIAKASHNIVLSKFIPSIHTAAAKGISHSRGPHMAQAVFASTRHYHHEICAFIRQRDGIGASLAMRQHLLLAIKNIVEKLNTEDLE